MSRSPWNFLIVAVVGAFIASACGEGTAATTATEPTTTTVTSSTTDPTTTTTTVPEDTTTLAAADVDDLLVVGDWGSGTLPQGAVAGAMMRYAETNDVDAILTTGDNFYSDDADFLMQPLGWATDAGIPFWVTWGNHDVETTARIDAVNEFFDDPPRWTTHRWGNVEIVILDSTQLGSDEQVAFFTETLAGSNLPTIVVFHYPPYSCGSHGDAETIQDDWVSLFDDDVFLVLSGHEHNYQRFEDGEVAYVVTGGGGATLTELASCPADHPPRSNGESLHHFLVLEQNDEIVVSAVDVNGDVIDEFSFSLP